MKARLIRAWHHSMGGLQIAIKQQSAIRLELWLTLIIMPLALLIGATAVARALLIASWLLVIIVELINSAIETVVNRIGPEIHTLSGQAKDLGSAAVLCAIVNAVVVWGLVLTKIYRT